MAILHHYIDSVEKQLNLRNYQWELLHLRGGHKRMENKTQAQMEAQALFKQCTRPNLKYISP